MEGKFDSLVDTLNNGKLLRITDCFVKQVKVNHFELAQKKVWLPEMKNNQGMLGGVFSKDKNNASHYLVSTFWSSLESHRKYVDTNLPILKVKAGIKNDIASSIGRQIVLIDSWKIINN